MEEPEVKIDSENFIGSDQDGQSNDSKKKSRSEELRRETI